LLSLSETSQSRDFCRARSGAGRYPGSEEVVDCFATAHQLCGFAVDEDFGGAGAGVVVGGLRHAIGSGVQEDNEISRFDRREGAVSGEEVVGLADWAYVDFNLGGGLPCWLYYWDDLVVRVVERFSAFLVCMSW
jgi:hypothetical protein